MDAHASFVDIETQNISSQNVSSSSSPSYTTRRSVSTNGTQTYVLHIGWSPALMSVLLILCSAIFTVTALIHSGILLEWLAFLLILTYIYIFSRLVVTALTYIIERYFVRRTVKVLYFLFALRETVVYFFRSSLLLLYWFLSIKLNMTIFAIYFVTSTLAALVIATVMWMLKIVILKLLDIRVRDKKSTHDLKDLISHEYTLQTMLGPARGSNDSNNATVIAQLRWIRRAFAYMLLLIFTRLHTICDALDHSNIEDDRHQVENVITMVFKNLTNNDRRVIQKTDLLWVMKREDIAESLQLFGEDAETDHISEEILKQWMIKVCRERRNMVHLLDNDSKVIKELRYIFLVNIIFLVSLAWCLLMGVGATKSLVYVVSPLLVLFIFGDYGKVIFEGIMLTIVMHPFKVGDGCKIGDKLLVVQEMGLIKTVFSSNGEGDVTYSNSVLLTQPICNFSRSSGLRETFEISVSSRTSSKTIEALQLKIDELLRSKPEIWHVEHCLDLQGVNNEMKTYNLQITHATKFHSFKENDNQRSDIISGLTDIFKERTDINEYTIQAKENL